jgi:hypothetical protein
MNSYLAPYWWLRPVLGTSQTSFHH